MKKSLILFFLTVTALLSALNIPYSKSEIKTAENCIDQLYRTNPDDSLVCEYSTKPIFGMMKKLFLPYLKQR